MLLSHITFTTNYHYVFHLGLLISPPSRSVHPNIDYDPSFHWRLHYLFIALFTHLIGNGLHIYNL
ncbi:hypothetical protein BDV28DRAFT_126589 [Aspergillus coremiiformis]|uniref:Uncharacterized protein n=1 Tax=Aspergillus coremiiformis TaxID=138285 RepID=A0A5N6ZG15_9EURO|nr:hypothetical protein BDV28DRAFT_126589 [Aspergillus coremiiformis]